MTHTQAPGRQVGAPPGAEALRWVEKCLGPGSRVKMSRPLSGGTAHINHALLVESGSGTAHRLVLRQWRRAGHTIIDTEFSVEREIAALALLAGAEIPTPSLVAADTSGAYCDVPTLLITRLDGHPPRPARADLPEYLIQLAAALLSVHTTGGAATMPPYAPYNRLEHRVPPRRALRPAIWEQAMDVVAGPPPGSAPHFIHRDYHPDNTLWTNGRLTGVIDWSNASYGPIAIDIAHMRWNLVLDYEIAAADRFLSAFDQVRGGYDHDPYWDLRCVVDLLPEDDGDPLSQEEAGLLEDYMERLLALFASV